MSQTDKHINTAESAMPNGTPALLTSSSDIASTEDKTPGCTITFTRKDHPFISGRSLIYVRGSFADGEYGALPSTSDGLPLMYKPKGESNERSGRMREYRCKGGYFVHSGSYRSGYVIDLPHEGVDDTGAWLAQLQASLESRIPQVPKPAKAGASKAKVAAPTDF